MIETSAKSGSRNLPDWVGLAARLLVGGVLLVAGALKITNVPEMRIAIDAYRIFPLQVADVLAWVVPISEIVLGGLLIIGMFTRLAAICASLMFASFIAGISWVWSQGYSIDCGCFGGGGQVAQEQTRYLTEILRDVGLLVAGLWLSIRPKSAVSVDKWLFAIPAFDDAEPTSTDPDNQEAAV